MAMTASNAELEDVAFADDVVEVGAVTLFCSAEVVSMSERRLVVDASMEGAFLADWV